MTFTKEQKKEAYVKLSPEVQSFIMDSETAELITNYLKETGLTPEQSNSADSEILYAMYGLQTLSEAIANIAKLNNKNINNLSKLKTNLENNIFSKIKTDKNPNETTKSLTVTGDWKSKVGEIAKKYSLNQSQTDKLINIITGVLPESKKPESLIETIISDLGISRLLAEQLMSDLETRVFEYALKEVKSEKLKVESKPFVSKGTFDTKVPEVKPTNLPMVEPGEIAHSNPPPRYIPTSTYKPTSIFQDNNLPSQSAPSPVPSSALVPGSSQQKSATSPEVVQQPIPVPRFTAVPMEKDDASETSAPKPEENVFPLPSVPIQNMMDQKLKTVTVGIKEEAKPKPPEKYTVDPYREPLE